VPDLDLELALASCGRDLAFPTTPDLVSAVARRLPARRQRRSRRRVLVLAFAIVLATAGIAAAVGASLHGLGIAFVDKLPAQTPGKGLDLGLPVKADEARSLAGFDLVLPGPPLGLPDAWFVDSAGGARVVTLVWRHRAGLPPQRKGVSVLVTETPGAIDPGLAKQLLAHKTQVQFMNVDGEQGIWISGAQHTLSYRSGTGSLRILKVRLVGNVLVWDRGDVLLRIEGARTLAGALRLASSFRKTKGTP
jgi:hypothetical protein